MKFGKFGVFTMTDALNAGQLGDMVARLEDLGYSTLWYPEAVTYETFALGSYLLSQSTRLNVASGIANIYARDPAAAASGHNTLNSLYDGRFVLGLGVSHPVLVSDMRGHEYKHPLSAMRDYLDGMDKAWAAMGGVPPQKQVVLAALGPKMSQLAAERTLGAFPYNITPEQADISRSNMGPDAAVICEQKVLLCTDPVKAREIARASLGFYMPMPNYFKNWFRLGFNEDDLKDGGSDRLMDAMVFWGEADEIKEKLQQYFDGGADQVVIQPLRVDGQAGPDWEALEAFAPN
ncbi:MAG TPA: LLM class F420-dependent oxidoreductase [Gammaproteobacteria bacterium]|nr:LLM class F420-dependent oxidoreductase [Gammaproteobacteria bacterium]|tara:strand:- start:4 stop:876 length:873 start_codon:yes stop_codon:yes gene_type:complete